MVLAQKCLAITKIMAHEPTPDEMLRNLMAFLAKLARTKMHGQVIVTLRDGKIHLIELRNTFQPDKLPL